MEDSIELTGAQDGPLVWGEADSIRRFELFVDDEPAGVGVRGSGGEWSVTGSGWLDFPPMTLPATLDEEAAVAAAVDALNDWIGKHRRDLWRDA
jgi:hypothetical protein